MHFERLSLARVGPSPSKSGGHGRQKERFFPFRLVELLRNKDKITNYFLRTIYFLLGRDIMVQFLN